MMAIKRKLLALAMCLCAVTAWADDSNYIINEDFADMPTSPKYPSSYNGWTLHSCCVATTGGVEDNNRLKIEKYTNSEAGYATTSTLGYSGDLLLMFSHARNNSDAVSNIYIRIQNGGTFDDGNTYKEFSITNSANVVYKTTSFRINNSTANTKIKFEQKKESGSTAYYNFYLDNVKVIKLGEITLDETINSSEAIDANADNCETVTANTRRRLIRGIWNTMCLPFDVTKSLLESALGTDKEIQLRTYSSYDAGKGVMSFTEPSGTIAAGMPFLIKLNADAENPTFEHVSLADTEAQTVTHGGVSFVGTYSPKTLATDGTNLFITQSNSIAKPTASGNKMNGLRAYISTAGSTPARLAISDSETADIQGIATWPQPQRAATYDLGGHRLPTGTGGGTEQSKRGLYIVEGKLTLQK